jgi:hypothetical protein
MFAARLKKPVFSPKAGFLSNFRHGSLSGND